MENQSTQGQGPSPFSGAGQQALPNAVTVMVLGIISIPGCFCYGLGLVFGIIALVLAKKDLALYNVNPSQYSQASFNNLKTGKTCAIIGLILSALYLTLVIIVLIIMGAGVLTNPGEFLKNYR